MSPRKLSAAVLAGAAAILAAPLADAAGPVTPGAVYSGFNQNGGAVTFEVTSDGARIKNFVFRNVVLKCDDGSTQQPFDANWGPHQESDGSTFPGREFTITGTTWSFTDSVPTDTTTITGSFAPDREVSGTYQLHVNPQSTPNGPTPACDSGQIAYQASTSTPAGPPPPQAGKTGTATPASGTVTVRQPGSTRSTPLAGGTSIPVGSTVDARKGTVVISTIGPDGKVQNGLFGGGIFKFTQKLEKVGSKRLLTTELTMKGGSFASCKARSAGYAEGARRRVVRYLTAQASGRFRVIGKNSSGVERGTAWKTSDLCTGTLTKVTDGAVLVTDFRRNKTITVKAGNSYLAKARAR